MSTARSATAQMSKKAGKGRRKPPPKQPTTRRQRTRATEDTGPRLTVFLSYSHKDASYLDKLRTHLQPLERQSIELWYDSDIKPGGELAPEIRKALSAGPGES